MQKAQERPLRIFCKGDQNLNIALKDGKLTLQRADPTDKTQHWFQCFDTFNLKDDKGWRPFALVNRSTSTWQAMEYRDTALKLADYNIEAGVKINMLWSSGFDLGDGFAEVRALKELSHTLNALGGNVEGTEIGIYGSRPDAVNSIWKFEHIPDQ